MRQREEEALCLFQAAEQSLFDKNQELVIVGSHHKED